jgi:TM2 domain-containing membrane protein YozV
MVATFQKTTSLSLTKIDINANIMTEPKSVFGGNLIAAIASFFIPGLGQLLQGRFVAALGFFVFSICLWLFFLGWLGHILSCLEAAFWKGRK